MSAKIGKNGKIIFTLLIAIIVMIQLFFVYLPSETEADFEKYSDLAGIVMSGALIVFLGSIWLLPYPRWLGISILISLIAMEYVVGIALGLCFR